MENKLFKMPPKSSDAQTVWLECNLPDIAPYKHIRDFAWNWVHADKDRLVTRGRHYYVKWTTKSGARLEAKWEAFLNWILCACEEYVPPPKINPFALYDTPSEIVFSNNFLNSYIMEDSDSGFLDSFSGTQGFIESIEEAADESRCLDRRRNAFSESDESPPRPPYDILLSKTPQPESPTD
jgi:hypothetical protein